MFPCQLYIYLYQYLDNFISIETDVFIENINCGAFDNSMLPKMIR